MARWDPVANFLVFGSLLNALDKIGLKPTLIGRQTARVLAPTLKDVYQKFSGTESAKTMEQFIIDYKTAMNNLNLLEAM